MYLNYVYRALLLCVKEILTQSAIHTAETVFVDFYTSVIS